MTPQPDPAVPPRRLAEIAARVAAPLTHEDSFGTGPLAELRRLDPNGALAETTLHRLLARHTTETEVGEAGFPAWALVIHALALAAPDHLSFPRREDEPPETDAEARGRFWAERSRRAQGQLGRALFEAGLSERRFSILLDATADDLRVALPRTVRFPRRSGQAAAGPRSRRPRRLGPPPRGRMGPVRPPPHRPRLLPGRGRRRIRPRSLIPRRDRVTRFLQIHSLASYPAVLLNRDDAGLAKRCPMAARPMAARCARGLVAEPEAALAPRRGCLGAQGYRRADGRAVARDRRAMHPARDRRCARRSSRRSVPPW